MTRSLVLVSAIVALAACGGKVSSPAATAPSATAPSAVAGSQTAGSQAPQASVGFPPLTLLASDATVAMYDGTDRAVELSGILTAGGDAVVSATTDVPGSTRVEWHRVPTGELLAGHVVDGDLTVSAVSSDGTLAALTDAEPGGTSTTSNIVVVNRNDGVLGQWSLAGNVVPEAFANAYVAEGNGMPIGVFAIEYLKPDVYRVRVIDTATGELGLPLNLRDKSQTVDEAMTAISRTAVFDRHHQLLFTLYQGTVDDMEDQYAFIHTLGLINGVWCLEVPEQLDLGEHTGALAVTPVGDRLYVASPNGGVASYRVSDLTDINAEPVAETVAQLDLSGSRVAIAATGDEVVVAFGSTVARLDPVTLAVRDTFVWDMSIEAVAVTDNGDVIIAGDARMTRISADHRLVAERPLPAGLAEVTGIVTGIVAANR